MMRPIIGICGSYLADTQQILLRDTYTAAVLEAGGLPLILPVTKDDLTIGELLDRIDGLLLSGGGDVDPACYGEEKQPECGESNAMRDAFELLITKKAVAKGMPIFGICRGIQVLNVAYGGTLVQDIPSACGFPLEKHRQPEPYDELWHDILLTEGGLLAQVTGETHFMTNSMHHQSLKALGGTLTIEARAEDGTIEAVSDRVNASIFGVQFHPEYLTGKSKCARALFAYFVKKAAQYGGKTE